MTATRWFTDPDFPEQYFFELVGCTLSLGRRGGKWKVIDAPPELPRRSRMRAWDSIGEAKREVLESLREGLGEHIDLCRRFLVVLDIEDSK